MYLTFLTTTAPKQLTWEDILNDPYLTVENSAMRPKKKVTKEISTEYAAQLWEKRKKAYEISTPWIKHVMEVYKLPDDEDTALHYSHFKIPKKSNPHKLRQIDAPDEQLSNIQGAYKDFIENTLQVLTHKAAHAYVKERSTVTAMQTHQRNNSKWYLQIDLKDFFNSINETWLKKMMLEIFPFKFIDEEDLNRIIKVSMLNGTLPQGSRLSPTLTNIAMVPIDYDITETLHNYKGHHYVYTRYADDITISCKEKFNEKEIINIIKSIFKKWETPFRINNEKTRFGSIAGRNYHLGIIVNKDNKLSVGHEKNQKFRAQIFNFCTVGNEWEIADVQKMLGLISYYKAIEPDFVEKVLRKYGEKFNMDIEKTAKELIK